jgi:hypothetical protein
MIVLVGLTSGLICNMKKNRQVISYTCLVSYLINIHLTTRLHENNNLYNGEGKSIQHSSCLYTASDISPCFFNEYTTGEFRYERFQIL